MPKEVLAQPGRAQGGGTGGGGGVEGELATQAMYIKKFLQKACILLSCQLNRFLTLI